jgi:hypothetical protein
VRLTVSGDYRTYLKPYIKKKTLWPESASELCRPSDRRLSAKLVPTFADRGSHVVSVTDPQAVFSIFLDRMLHLHQSQTSSHTNTARATIYFSKYNITYINLVSFIRGNTTTFLLVPEI